VLGDTENLTEERVDEVLSKFLKDFKEGSLETKGWSCLMAAYRVSKAALNAYTRIVAKNYPSFRVNCLCPGLVKTDGNTAGILTIDEGAESVVRLASYCPTMVLQASSLTGMRCRVSFGWSCLMAAYRVSKAALNAYTRIVAKNYPSFRVNCLCSGLVKTDANTIGILTIDEDA
jgi:NAD(P)-dependent dehydrogenase (short-subunit alcohol dehydrogenase family)